MELKPIIRCAKTKMLMLLFADGFRKELDFQVSLSGQNFTSCHDLHVASTERILHLMKNSIRADCSATYNAEYVPHKDISLPLSGLPFDLPPLEMTYTTGTFRFSTPHLFFLPNELSTMLASWAGPGNSDVRDELVHAWNNDTIHIRNNLISTCTSEGHPLPQKKFYKSRLCICPRGPLLDGVVLI
ncbi:hypothetical protein H0E87_021734 [Populus deltoides]|uniref:Uncharacterized protein n=1 Tax=Populus deltoides TaxID=3696 RepID=A0A8T2XJP3_POPDE|nr:hypothetical protein H0E87_021734 [Populus deltoides]